MEKFGLKFCYYLMTSASFSLFFFWLNTVLFTGEVFIIEILTVDNINSWWWYFDIGIWGAESFD